MTHQGTTADYSPVCEHDAAVVDLRRHPARPLIMGSQPDVVSPPTPLPEARKVPLDIEQAFVEDVGTLHDPGAWQ